MWATLNKANKIKFILQIIVIFLIAATWFFLVKHGIHPTKIYTGKCFFRYTLGMFCPGCGGTRAFDYMLYGHFLKSFFYHPIVLSIMAMLLYSTISYILYFVTKGKFLYNEIKLKQFIYVNFIIVATFFIRNFLVFELNYYIF